MFKFTVLVGVSIASLCETSKANRYEAYIVPPADHRLKFSKGMWLDMRGEYSVRAQSSIFSIVLLFLYSFVLLFSISSAVAAWTKGHASYALKLKHNCG